MALSAPANRDIGPLARAVAHRIGNSQTVYIGSYVVIDTNGDLRPLADTTNFEPMGFVIGFDTDATAESDTGDTTANEPPKAIVDIGEKLGQAFSVTGATAESNKGDLVYATDDDTFTTSATSNIPAVGVVHDFRSSTVVDVIFFSYTEMRNN